MKSPQLRKIPPDLLKTFSEGCQVDSPVYFSSRSWVRRLNWAKLARLYTMMRQVEELKVLDFACGNGVMFPTWEMNFAKTVGIDLHVQAADRVRRHFGLQRVHLAKAEGLLLPFAARSFDLVFAASTLEHFRALEGPLTEIRRVLRQGGQLVFLCPNENHFYDWGRRIAGYTKPPEHHHTADEVLSMVGRFFKVEAVRHFPSYAPSFLAIYKMGRAVNV